MLTYQQAEYWFSPLVSFCILTIIVSLFVMLLAFFCDQHRKRIARIARLAVLVLGGLALFCCALWLVLTGSNQGLAIIFLAPIDVLIVLLMLFSGLLLVNQK